MLALTEQPEGSTKTKREDYGWNSHHGRLPMRTEARNGVPPNCFVCSSAEHVSGTKMQHDNEYNQRRKNREHTAREARKKCQCPVHDSIVRLGRARGRFY